VSEGVNKNRIELQRIVQLCCENPAKIFGLYPRKGVIQVGSDADLAIVDMKKEDVIRADQFQCIGGFTPFENWRIKGKPVLTLVRGQIVADDGNVVGKPGYGEFIPSSR
jgi:dihydroorotase-like cyclic amidohydrolase